MIMAKDEKSPLQEIIDRCTEPVKNDGKTTQKASFAPKRGGFNDIVWDRIKTKEQNKAKEA